MPDEYGPDDPRWEAVHRFLDGLSPLPERREVERWMADDLSLQRYVKAHKKVWSMIAQRLGPTPVDPEDAWEAIQDRVAEHDRRERFHLPGRGLEHLRVVDGGLATGSRMRVPIARAIAASAAVLVLGVTSIVLVRNRSSTRVPLHGAPPFSARVAFAARRGEHPRTERLPDSTEVVLAPDSHLEYAVEPSGTHLVTLVGEASFTVQHRANRTFVVRAGGIETRDLGTDFDVRAYPGSGPAVGVRSGRVSVQTAHGTTIIEGGLIGSLDAASKAMVVSPAPPDYFEWIRGRLAFHNTPLREVAAQLGRAYDLDFRVPDPTLSARSVTITVPSGTLEEALALLNDVAGLQYERHGREIRLFRR
jgi:ferric-dicitrate binding protein FerR (iron transport regulator)